MNELTVQIQMALDDLQPVLENIPNKYEDDLLGIMDGLNILQAKLRE